MKSIFTVAVCSFVALAACDGANPFDVVPVVDPGIAPVIDPDNPVGTNGIPLQLSGNGEGENLRSIAFDPVAGTLSVDMAALDLDEDGSSLESYQENLNLQSAALAANNYRVYSYQDDGLDRFFVAIVAESADGSVQGAIVMDGGQFNRFYGGGFYATDGTYTPGSGPNDTGQVSYAGLYAGATNVSSDGAELIGVPPIPGDDEGVLLPDQPAQLEGSIFFNVNFDDNTINGAIYDRSWTNLHPVLAAIPEINNLQDIVLVPTAITDAGTFFGEAETRDDEGNLASIGNYGGAFGGTEAPAVGGVVHLEEHFTNADDFELEEEFGVFVLTQCGQPGEAAICGAIPVNP